MSKEKEEKKTKLTFENGEDRYLLSEPLLLSRYPRSCASRRTGPETPSEHHPTPVVRRKTRPVWRAAPGRRPPPRVSTSPALGPPVSGSSLNLRHMQGCAEPVMRFSGRARPPAYEKSPGAGHCSVCSSGHLMGVPWCSACPRTVRPGLSASSE